MDVETQKIFIDLFIETGKAIVESVCLIAPWALLGYAAIYFEEMRKIRR